MRSALWRYRMWWLAPIAIIVVLFVLLVVAGGGDAQRVYPRF